MNDAFRIGRDAWVSLSDLRARLRSDVRDVARELFGEPRTTRGIAWRWRPNDSLRVYVAGPRQGLWRDEVENKGGDPLAMVETTLGLDFPRAVAWAAARYGLAEAKPRDPAAEERHRRALADLEAERAAEAAAMRAEDIAKAQALFNAGVPIQGTPAELNLLGRGIIEPGRYQAFRYHVGARALLVAITTDGAVHSVQRIFVDRSGRNILAKGKLDGTKRRKLKLATGPYYGAFGRLEAFTDSPVLVHGEGAETVASVCSVAGFEGRVTFGGLPVARLEAGRINLLLADDDNPEGPAARARDHAVEQWRMGGIAFVIAYARDERRGDGYDWNDLLRESGPDAVHARLAQVLGPIEPPGLRASETMQKVREVCVDTIRSYFGGTLSFKHALLSGATGAGKTQAVIEIFAQIARMRREERAVFIRTYILQRRCSEAVAAAAADAAGLKQLRLRYFAETHELVGQALTLARQLGLTTAHDGGYDTPFNPADKASQAACSQPTRRELTQAAGAAMPTSACGVDLLGPHCPDREGCGFWIRRGMAANAEMVGSVIERVVDPFLPRALSSGFDFTIIDEGLDRVAYPSWEMGIEVLAEHHVEARPVLGESGEPNRALTDELLAGYAAIRFAFNSVAQGYVTPPLDNETLLRLAELTDKRDRQDKLTPATSDNERASIAVTSYRPKLRRICGMLRAMAAGPGRVSVRQAGDHRIATVRPMPRINESILAGSVLLADASGKLAELRRLFPDVGEVTPPPPMATHQTTVQFYVPAGKHAMRKPARLEYMQALVDLYRNGETGLITHQEHEQKFANQDLLLGHPGALAGRNLWKTSSTLFGFGLPSLSPGAAAANGAARTGEQVPVEMPIPVWRGVNMRDGSVEYLRTLTFRNLAAREAQEAVRERQAIQGIAGRGRGANRGPDDPLLLIYAGTTPLPGVVVDVLIRGPAQHAPGRFVRAVANGFVLQSGADRARMQPSIYPHDHTSDYDHKFEVGGTLTTLRRVLFPSWRPSGPKDAWCAGVYWVAGSGNRSEGRVFACELRRLDAVKAALAAICRATEFRITEPLLRLEPGNPVEVTRNALSKDTTASLVTCPGAAIRIPDLPAGLLADGGDSAITAQAPPDG